MPIYIVILFFSIALFGIYPPADVGLFSIGPAKIQALDLVFILITSVLLKRIFSNLLTSYYAGKPLLICRKSDQIFKWIVLYFIVSACFGILFGLPKYGYRAIGEARQSIIVLLYFFLTISSIKSTKDVRRTIVALVYFQYLVVILAFLRLLGIFGEVDIGDARLLNSTEGMHLFLVLVTVLYLKQQNILSKPHATFFIAFSSLVLIIAQIKTIWVIGAICGVIVLFGNRKYFVRNIVLTGIAFPIIYFVSTSILMKSELFSGSFQRQAELFEQGSEGETIVWRVLQWEQAFRLIKANPITGIGFGSHNQEISLPGAAESYPIHSAYIERALKTGIPSLIIYFIALFHFWKSLRRSIRQTIDPFDKAMMRVCNLTIFSYIMFFVTYNDTALLWIYIGIGYSLMYLKNNNSTADKSSIVQA